MIHFQPCEAHLIRDLRLDDGGPQHRLAQRLQRLSVQRALRGLCDRVGRASTPGKPWLWRLKARPLRQAIRAVILKSVHGRSRPYS